MNIFLTQQDCQNVKVALLIAMKQQSVDENAMATLLQLSQKFNWTDNQPKTVKQEKEDINI